MTTSTPTTSTSTPIRKGDRVTITGHGRTARWPSTLIGTVKRGSRGRIYVHWDGTRFEDEMRVEEVVRA